MYLKKILSLLLLAPLLLSQVHAADNITPKIINGEKSDLDSWPFMVALVFKNREVNNGQFCGGSFLGGRYILTAAHCVSGKEGQDLDAVIGISDLTQDDVSEHRYNVKEVYIHEDYQSASVSNDIAILELEREVNYTAVDLADKHLRNNLSAGEMLTVMGWGDQVADPGESRFESELYQVDIPLVEQVLCPYPVSSQDDAFCAGFVNGGYDSCQGDSGGPIVVASGNGYEQLGIVSWGEGCAEAGNYGVYTNLSHFSDWISAKTQGFSYRQSEFVGIKPLGGYTHTFAIENNTGQVITTFGATIQGVGASIIANNCSVITVNDSCAVTINYNIVASDSGEVTVRMATDHAQTPSVDMALSYSGVETAPISVSEMVSIVNTGVYSSANSWVKSGNAIVTPTLSDNEFSQLAISGIAAGYLSFDYTVSTEQYFDYFNIYVNGDMYDRLSGSESGEYIMNLSRDNNTIIFEYQKDYAYASGDDRVTIRDLTYSAEGESVIPAVNPMERGSGGSGGAIHWIYLWSLGLLVFARKRRV